METGFLCYASPTGVNSYALSFPNFPELSDIVYDERFVIETARRALENHILMLYKRHTRISVDLHPEAYTIKADNIGTILMYIPIDLESLYLKVDNELIEEKIMVPYALSKKAHDEGLSLTRCLCLGFEIMTNGVDE